MHGVKCLRDVGIDEAGLCLHFHHNGFVAEKIHHPRGADRLATIGNSHGGSRARTGFFVVAMSPKQVPTVANVAAPTRTGKGVSLGATQTDVLWWSHRLARGLAASKCVTLGGSAPTW